MSEKFKIELSKVVEKKFEYDVVPYISYPFTNTRPEYLRTVGLLFGADAPPIETARILELGCSSGSNVMRFANSYPKSHTIGIDLSQIEIDHGLEKLQSLGIKNLELKAFNIMDIDDSWGKFDYIICHGVFSWVPEVVREKIIKIANNNLSPNGIAYISYNIKPGWNMGNTIRDMMNFHGGMFENVKDKITQARLFLNFVTDALEGSQSPYATFLKQEAKQLSSKEDSYIFGEYLVENNYQPYFNEFIKKAREQNLEYLADVNFNTMYIGNMPQKVVQELSTINDIVRTEQYMDFISNRRFRCTLLCNKNMPINRSLYPRTLDKFNLGIHLVAEVPESEENINQVDKNINFYYKGNKDNNIGTTNPIMKAILYVFSENVNNFLSLEEIAKLAMKKLKKVQLSEIKDQLDANMLNLMFKGFVNIVADPVSYIYKVSEKPKVSDLVRMQLQYLGENKLWVTNELNEIININLFDKFLLSYLDETNDRDSLIVKMFEHVKKQDLKLYIDEKEIVDVKIQKETVEKLVDQCLTNFKINALLIA